MHPVLVASSAVVLVLVVCVVATMAVENWARWRVQIRAGVRRAPLAEPTAETTAEPTAEPELELVADPLEVTADTPDPPVPEYWEATGRSSEVQHVIEGRHRADQLVAVLLAAYAAARLPEARRAAAWVTAAAQPEGCSGSEFVPGADLRGRPAAAARLLACDVDGRTWVTLNDTVDIGRGLSLRAPTCPTLLGITELWAATRAAMSEVDDVQARRVADAIAAVEPRWRGTPAAPDVLSLLVACTESIESGSSLRLRVTNAPRAVPAEEPGPDQPGTDATEGGPGQTDSRTRGSTPRMSRAV